MRRAAGPRGSGAERPVTRTQYLRGEVHGRLPLRGPNENIIAFVTPGHILPSNKFATKLQKIYIYIFSDFRSFRISESQLRNWGPGFAFHGRGNRSGGQGRAAARARGDGRFKAAPL